MFQPVVELTSGRRLGFEALSRGPRGSGFESADALFGAAKAHRLEIELEAVPEARAVVNFAPILLEQLEDYITQIKAYLNGHGVIQDPLLAELAEPALPGNTQERLRLMQECLRANRERMIERFEPFQRLATMAEWYETHPDSMIYASNQFIADLMVWYHLAWFGECVRLNDLTIRSLQTKGKGFDLDDRKRLLTVIREVLSSLT